MSQKPADPGGPAAVHPSSGQKKAPPGETPSSRKWLYAMAGALGILILVALLVLGTFRGVTIYQMVMTTVLVAYFPISYLAFEVRSERRKERLVSRIALLGFASEEEQQKWENLYQQIYSPQQFVLFVGLATLVSLLGFGLMRFSWSAGPLAIPGGIFLEQVIAQTMFYSFLGAYIFSIYNVLRRFVTFDLQPGVYMNVAVLMVTVMAIAFIVALQLKDEKLLLPGGSEALEFQKWIPVVAFLIGYLPDAGFRWLTTLASRYIKLGKRRETRLENIDGVSIWHETRLRESGVDNVQNLAATDVRQLLLTSRFSMAQVMNWVDQAILLINVPEKSAIKLRNIGITTMTSLISLVNPIQGSDPKQLQIEELDDQKSVLSNSELTSLASIMRASLESSPNLAYVMAYWKAVRQVEPEQIRAQAENVLADITRRAASPILADERAIELISTLVDNMDLEANDLERLFSKDSELLVGLANVYTNNQDYTAAIRVLSEAIEKSVAVPVKQAPAYASRGLAHGMLAQQRKANQEDFQEDYDCAGKDFTAAKERDPDYSGTYNNEGAVWIARQDFQKAVAALDQAIELNPSLAKAFLNRGKAHSNLANNDTAIADFTRAIELARAYGLESVLRDAYYERATLYLNNRDGEKAERDFGETLYLSPLNATAYLGRGQALLLGKGKSSYTRAIYYFEMAIDLYTRKARQERKPASAEKAVAYSNMGQAYLLLEQPIDALTNIDQALAEKDTRAINYKVRGLANIRIGNTAQAVKDLTIYMNMLPDDAPDRANAATLVKQLQEQAAPAEKA